MENMKFEIGTVEFRGVEVGEIVKTESGHIIKKLSDKSLSVYFGEAMILSGERKGQKVKFPCTGRVHLLCEKRE